MLHIHDPVKLCFFLNLTFFLELTTGAARCPLCHEDVNLPLDGGWKRHLLSKSGCPGNISRKRNKT